MMFNALTISFVLRHCISVWNGNCYLTHSTDAKEKNCRLSPKIEAVQEFTRYDLLSLKSVNFVGSHFGVLCVTGPCCFAHWYK